MYRVCNVLCLCLTSLTCNSMSRRRKEKDSLMRFVIVSIISFTWLFAPPNLKTIGLPFSHSLVWIRQAVKYELCTCRLKLPRSCISQTTVSIQGTEGGRWCCEGRSSKLTSSHQHPLGSQLAARMTGYFCLRFYLHCSLLW